MEKLLTIRKQGCCRLLKQQKSFPFSDSSSLNSSSVVFLVLCCSGSWKEKKFKPYNFEALGVAPDCGHLHPLMKVRTQFRQIFLEMG